MTEIAFYHLQKSPLEAVLPRLLEKTLEAGKRAVVKAGSAERAEALTGHLWTYEERSWLPHGNARDGHAEGQPIWLTATDENPNGAQFLFLADGAESDHVGAFERCFVLFDGNSEASLAAARAQWKGLKEAGHDMTYWQQTEAGGWEKRA